MQQKRQKPLTLGQNNEVNWLVIQLEVVCHHSLHVPQFGGPVQQTPFPVDYMFLKGELTTQDWPN
jgi:hypothetical protein